MDQIDFPAGRVEPHSVVTEGSSTYFLAHLSDTGERCLGVKGDASGFSQNGMTAGEIAVCALTLENARALRARLPWLNPAPLGLKTSFGFGDRIGSATPGHIHALRSADPA